MPDYKFVLYETLDSGTVARIMLNRPDARNAQNRGLLVELNDAFLQAEADDEVRVVILGGTGPMFSSGHDLGSKAAREEGMPGPNQHPTHTINGATRKGAEALMLQEWHYFFENTRRWRNLRKITIGQAHGDVYAAGPDAALGLRPHRLRRGHALRRRRRDPARHVRGRVLRPPVGVRAPQGQGASPDRRLGRRRRGAPPGHGEQGLPADDELGDRTVEFAQRIAQLPTMTVAADQGGGEPERGQHGLLQRAQRLLHAARAEPLPLGLGQRGPATRSPRRTRASRTGRKRRRSCPRSRTRCAPKAEPVERHGRPDTTPLSG